MKLTIKVVIAFAILCGLMALGGAFSYFNMSRIDAAFSLVVKDIARLREDGNAIGQGLLRISKMSNDMVFANNKKELEQARDSFVSESRGLDQKIDDLSGALQTWGVRETVQPLLQSSRRVSACSVSGWTTSLPRYDRRLR